MSLHILHLHSSFNLGGKEARAVRLMNLFGDAAHHTIVSGMPDQLGAREAIAKGIRYQIVQNPPPLTGKPSVARYEALARFMRPYDLVLSYNWGAIDGVMARRVFPKGAPPLIHHEDGFNSDEANGLKIERNVYRRIALAAAYGLVVPSQTLEAIALRHWKQPAARLHRIVNGIPLAQYQAPPQARSIPGFRKKPGDVVIGTLAGLRAVKDLPKLVRAVGGVSARVQLVIVGEGPERATIEQAARAMGIGDRLHMPGFLPDPHRYVGLFDIFALSSRSEQFPISVVEAMAAGVPVAAPRVGDLEAMVAAENRPFIVPNSGEVDLRNAIQILADDAGLRAAVGAANRDESIMIRAYASLYDTAMGRNNVLMAQIG
jgi:glycosyltransferase involved in cell wall biosynthesis